MPLIFRVVQYAHLHLEVLRLHRAFRAAKGKAGRQGVQPQPPALDILPLGQFGQIPHNGHHLGHIGTAGFPLRLHLQLGLAHSVNKGNGIVPLDRHRILRGIIRPAPGGLAQGEILVVAHLEVEPAGIF